MGKPLFLQAIDGSNKTVPVWFMRQAGRYLPEYQKLKSQYELNDLFKEPELAAKITALPVDILGVDAAVLFADILTLPSLMGINVNFHKDKGPIVETTNNFLEMKDIDSADYVEKACTLSKQQLSQKNGINRFCRVALYSVDLFNGGSLKFEFE